MQAADVGERRVDAERNVKCCYGLLVLPQLQVAQAHAASGTKVVRLQLERAPALGDGVAEASLEVQQRRLLVVTLCVRWAPLDDLVKKPHRIALPRLTPHQRSALCQSLLGRRVPALHKDGPHGVLRRVMQRRQVAARQQRHQVRQRRGVATGAEPGDGVSAFLEAGVRAAQHEHLLVHELLNRRQLVQRAPVLVAHAGSHQEVLFSRSDMHLPMHARQGNGTLSIAGGCSIGSYSTRARQCWL
mmetsp:Transcript_18083/g.54057  ORF Transcript_18083/g.54057 Transcript_18083/m.54057 type:complete len:244 (+) Transcript_18083:323-1054(+)